MSQPLPIRGGFTLLEDAWAKFRSHWKEILLFQLFQFVLGLLALLGILLASRTELPIVLTMLMIIVGIVLGIWIGVAQLYFFHAIVRGQTPLIGDSLKQGWKNFLPILLICVLQLLVTLGGFLLLVVPGILWSIRFSQATYCYVTEGVRGRAALKRSWQLTNGVSWILLARGYAVGIIMVTFGAAAFIPFLGSYVIAPFLFGPLMIMMYWFLFMDIAETKHREPAYRAPYHDGVKTALLLPMLLFPLAMVLTFIGVAAMIGAATGSSVRFVSPFSSSTNNLESSWSPSGTQPSFEDYYGSQDANTDAWDGWEGAMPDNGGVQPSPVINSGDININF